MQAFASGHVPIEIIGERKSRRASAGMEASLSRVLARQQAGDANCDGVVNLKDPIRVNDFIATRNGGFSTTFGKLVQSMVTDCPYYVSTNKFDFMDMDENKAVEGTDATFLLDVLVGNFYFLELNAAFENNTEEKCTMGVAMGLQNSNGELPQEGLRLQMLVDIILTESGT
eukprot:m.104642 g.104642  ORF g.104642 m.104642 type:complete len:171 (+) comp13851_c0_seq3:27-539(+)